MKKNITLFGVLMMICNICCSAESRSKQYTAEVRFESLRSYPDSTYSEYNAILFSGCDGDVWQYNVRGEAADRLYLELRKPESDFSITTWVDKSDVDVDSVGEIPLRLAEPVYHYKLSRPFKYCYIETIMSTTVPGIVYADSVATEYSAVLNDVSMKDLYWGGAIVDKSENRLKVELMQDLSGSISESLVTGWVDKGTLVVYPSNHTKAGAGVFFLYQQPDDQSNHRQYDSEMVGEFSVLDYVKDSRTGETWLKVEFIHRPDGTTSTGWIDNWCDSVWTCGN